MPHKHKRKRDDDDSNFNLAPDNRARPLAAYNKASIFTETDQTPSNKRRKPNSNSKKSNKPQDDTPKAFVRLMAKQLQGKTPNGLDDGTPKKKKQKKQPRKISQKPKDSSKVSSATPDKERKPAAAPKPPAAAAAAATTATVSTQPKILPGESLSSFALRVDQSLPLNSSTHHTTTTPAGSTLPQDLQAQLKKSQRTTKHNRRLQRMQADWRDTEARLKARKADLAAELEDEREEHDLLWAGVRSTSHSRKGKKNRKHKNGNDGEDSGDDDDDPWKALNEKRRQETRQKSLQDVVLAPPVLLKMKMVEAEKKFKVRAEDYDVVDRR